MAVSSIARTLAWGSAAWLLVLGLACEQSPDGARRDSFERALAQALQLDDPLLRAERVASQLQHLDAGAAEIALDVFDRELARVSADDAAWFAIAAARVDPVLTLDRILTWPADLRERGAAEAVADWAKRDPAAAAAELRARSAPDLTPALIRGWAQRDPEGALRFVDGQPSGSSRTRQVRAFVEVLHSQQGGTGAGVRWLEALLQRGDLSAPVRRELLVAAVARSAAIDPVGTAAWLTPRVGTPEATGAVAALASEWGALDPPGAAAWLSSLAPSAERDAALRELFQSWSVREPQEAQRWRFESMSKARAEAPPGDAFR